ncbi:MAG TPA: GlsB/YeaQ/YmgE family stress response membrane protein [Methylomirabilota bacterium]|nr:GlsB/YeaQ/YmgE family stress response membrane protein [Methylomirabilota bacterium]
MGLLISIIVGGVIGWFASLIMRTDAQIGILGNIGIGIVGSGLGHVLAGLVGLAAYGWPARTLISIIGAVILIWLLRFTGVLM